MNETLLGKENGNALMDLFLNSTSMYYRVIVTRYPTLLYLTFVQISNSPEWTSGTSDLILHIFFLTALIHITFSFYHYEKINLSIISSLRQQLLFRFSPCLSRFP